MIGVGILLCIPAALVVIAFAAGVADANALDAAPICPTPTQAAGSNCLSVFKGTMTAWTPHSKQLDRVTLAVSDASYDLGYDCAESPSRACDGLAFKPGTPVLTGWWRGQLVVFGAAEARPAVVTELHPLDQLRPKSVLLDFVVIPAVSFLMGGLMLLQAPMSVDALVKSALAKWPNPPRLVDRRVIWRVALAYWAPPAYIVWFVLDMFVGLVTYIAFAQYRLALPILAITFLLSIGGGAVFAGQYLTDIIRTSDRRALTVRKIKTGLGRSGKDTEVTYDLLNGKTSTTTLNLNWNGCVTEGDNLDALTDKDGSILRLLSTPPAQA